MTAQRTHTGVDHQDSDSGATHFTTQFTCFTSTKVHRQKAATQVLLSFIASLVQSFAIVQDPEYRAQASPSEYLARKKRFA